MGLKIINDTSVPVAVDSSVYFDGEHLADDFCKVLSPGESVVLRDEALTDENRSDVSLINASDGSFKDRAGKFNIEEETPKLTALRPTPTEISESDLKRRLEAGRQAESADILTKTDWDILEKALEPAEVPFGARACLDQINAQREELCKLLTCLQAAKDRILMHAHTLPEVKRENEK